MLAWLRGHSLRTEDAPKIHALSHDFVASHWLDLKLEEDTHWDSFFRSFSSSPLSSSCVSSLHFDLSSQRHTFLPFPFTLECAIHSWTLLETQNSRKVFLLRDKLRQNVFLRRRFSIVFNLTSSCCNFFQEWHWLFFQSSLDHVWNSTSIHPRNADPLWSDALPMRLLSKALQTQEISRSSCQTSHWRQEVSMSSLRGCLLEIRSPQDPHEDSWPYEAIPMFHLQSRIQHGCCSDLSYAKPQEEWTVIIDCFIHGQWNRRNDSAFSCKCSNSDWGKHVRWSTPTETKGEQPHQQPHGCAR